MFFRLYSELIRLNKAVSPLDIQDEEVGEL